MLSLLCLAIYIYLSLWCYVVVSKHVLGELVSEVVIPDANPAYYFFPYLPYSAYFVLGFFFFLFEDSPILYGNIFHHFNGLSIRSLGARASTSINSRHCVSISSEVFFVFFGEDRVVPEAIQSSLYFSTKYSYDKLFSLKGSLRQL